MIIRKPCFFHAHCDETAVGFLHGRSAKEGPLTEEEHKKLCWMCEGMFPKIRKALLETGHWKCPICGTEHTFNPVTKEIKPVLSKWYDGIAAEG